MPSIQRKDFNFEGMKHPKGTSQDDRLRARAVKLCHDVVEPDYLEKLREIFEPHFQAHLTR